jgi:hypothetical protein
MNDDLLHIVTGLLGASGTAIGSILMFSLNRALDRIDTLERSLNSHREETTKVYATKTELARAQDLIIDEVREGFRTINARLDKTMTTTDRFYLDRQTTGRIPPTDG